MSGPLSDLGKAGIAVALFSGIGLVLSPDRPVMVIHAFLLLSAGTGFGLVLPDAMAAMGIEEVPADE